MTIPPNTAAHFSPRATNASGYSLDGKPVSDDTTLVAGSYTFTAIINPPHAITTAEG